MTNEERQRQAAALARSGLLREILIACRETATEQWISGNDMQTRELAWLRFHAATAFETQLIATLGSLTTAETQDHDD